MVGLLLDLLGSKIYIALAYGVSFLAIAGLFGVGCGRWLIDVLFALKCNANALVLSRKKGY